MTEDEVLAEFRASHALLEGHFVLSSGRHSAFYLQCARVLMDPERAGRLALALVHKLPRDLRTHVRKVVSPAMGGIIIGHEMGRALGVEAVFLERPEGVFELRRGFDLEEGEKVLMVEDVITTGLSSREAMKAVEAGEKVLMVEDVVTTGLSGREAMKAVEAAGAEVVAAAALVDRTGGSVDLGVPFHALVTINFPTYAEDEWPAELATIPAVKPGSRKK